MSIAGEVCTPLTTLQSCLQLRSCSICGMPVYSTKQKIFCLPVKVYEGGHSSEGLPHDGLWP